MALGLTQYVIFRRNLGEHGRTVAHPLSHSAFWRAAAVAGVVLGAIAVGFATGLITLANLSQFTTAILVMYSGEDRYHDFPDGFFTRLDEDDDRLFYGLPRLVQHIDDGAIAAARDLYDELGLYGEVLDLCSSWVSHLARTPQRLVGSDSLATEGAGAVGDDHAEHHVAIREVAATGLYSAHRFTEQWIAVRGCEHQ